MRLFQWANVAPEFLMAKDFSDCSEISVRLSPSSLMFNKCQLCSVVWRLPAQFYFFHLFSFTGVPPVKLHLLPRGSSWYNSNGCKPQVGLCMTNGRWCLAHRSLTGSRKLTCENALASPWRGPCGKELRHLPTAMWMKRPGGRFFGLSQAFR